MIPFSCCPISLFPFIAKDVYICCVNFLTTYSLFSLIHLTSCSTTILKLFLIKPACHGPYLATASNQFSVYILLTSYQHFTMAYYFLWPLSLSFSLSFCQLISTHNAAPPPAPNSLGSTQIISSIFMVSSTIYRLKRLKFLKKKKNLYYWFVFHPWALYHLNCIPPLGCLINTSNVTWTMQNYKLLFHLLLSPPLLSLQCLNKWHHHLPSCAGQTLEVIFHFFSFLSHVKSFRFHLQNKLDLTTSQFFF